LLDRGRERFFPDHVRDQMEVFLWDAGSLLDGHLNLLVPADDTQTACIQGKNGVPYIVLRTIAGRVSAVGDGIVQFGSLPEERLKRWQKKLKRTGEQDNRQRRIKEVHRELTTRPYALLLSLITIVREPRRGGLVSESMVVEDVLAWCSRYGLPDTEEFLTDDGSDCLSLRKFQYHTLLLYLIVRLWIALLENERKTIDDYLCFAINVGLSGRATSPDLTIAPYVWLGKVLETPDVDRVISAHTRDVWARYYIGDLINAHIGRAGVQLAVPASNTESGRFFVRVPSLFDLCYLQLAGMIAKPQDGSEIRKNLRTCSTCQRLFWGRKNALYCGRKGCSRKSAYNRKHSKGAS
jgi:hypothetical protein